MEIKEIKSKYLLEDIVWFMYKNKPSQAIVTRINIEIREEVYIHGSDIPNILRKTINFFNKHKRTLSISYNINKINNGRFECALSSWYPENMLFATKEELLKSL